MREKIIVSDTTTMSNFSNKNSDTSTKIVYEITCYNYDFEPEIFIYDKPKFETVRRIGTPIKSKCLINNKRIRNQLPYKIRKD